MVGSDSKGTMNDVITSLTRHTVICHFTEFCLLHNPVMEPWGVDRIYDWLGWFYDHGLLFTYWDDKGLVALSCMRIVKDPKEAAICKNAYLLDMEGEHVFVDFVLARPGEKKRGLMNLWTRIHNIVAIHSPQCKWVSWLRYNSTKPIFTYRINKMHAKLNTQGGR